jgi:hypothetical protein
MKVLLKVNIIHTTKLPLSVLELERVDRYLEEKLNQFLETKGEDWKYSIWKIFSEQIEKQEFKKSKRITKSKLMEYYAWFPANTFMPKIDYYIFYIDCLKKALQNWLKEVFQVEELDFLAFWESIENEIPTLEKELELV